MGIILARTLGPDRYGAWVIAFSLANTLSVLGLLGADWLLMRHGSHLQDSGDEQGLRRTIHVAFLLSAVGLAIGAAILVATAPVLAEDVFHRAELTSLLRLGAALGVVLGIGSVLLYAAQAFRQVRQIAIIRNVAGPALRVVAVAIAAFAGTSATTYLAAIVVAEVIVVVLAARD